MILYKRKTIYYFSKFIFSANQIGILGIDLDILALDDDNNFDEDGIDTIIYTIIIYTIGNTI